MLSSIFSIGHKNGDIMIEAIAGDIIGSIYEWNNIKTKEFPLFGTGCHFTDDSVLSIALADSMLNDMPYLTRSSRLCGPDFAHS